MVQTYKKKRTKPDVNENDMKAAVTAVKENKMPLRRAATIYGLIHTALYCRVKKEQTGEHKNMDQNIQQSKFFI